MDSVLVRGMINNFSVIHLKGHSTTVPSKVKSELQNITADLSYSHLYKGFLLFFYLTDTYSFYYQSILPSLRIFKV